MNTLITYHIIDGKYYRYKLIVVQKGIVTRKPYIIDGQQQRSVGCLV